MGEERGGRGGRRGYGKKKEERVGSRKEGVSRLKRCESGIRGDFAVREREKRWGFDCWAIERRVGCCGMTRREKGVRFGSKEVG